MRYNIIVASTPKQNTAQKKIVFFNTKKALKQSKESYIERKRGREKKTTHKTINITELS